MVHIQSAAAEIRRGKKKKERRRKIETTGHNIMDCPINRAAIKSEATKNKQELTRR